MKNFEIEEHGLLDKSSDEEGQEAEYANDLLKQSHMSIIDSSQELSMIYNMPINLEDMEKGKMNKLTLVSCFFVLGVVFGGGTVGAFTNLYHNHNAILMNWWRAQSNFVISIPLMIYLILQEKKQRTLREIFNFKTCQMIFAVGCIFCFASTCFIISSTLTVLSHTQVLGTCTGMIIILIRLLTCKDLHKYEKLGAFFIIIGMAVLMSDGRARKGDGKEASLWGEFFGFMWSAFYVFFFLINSVLVKRIHGMIVYTFMNLVVVFILTPYLIYTSHIDITDLLSINTEYGIFGWYSPDKIQVSVLVGLISGLFGNGAYVMINKYFEPHIASIFFLFQPAVSQLLGLVFNLDYMPGILTWIGFLITSVSIYGIFINNIYRNHPRITIENERTIDV